MCSSCREAFENIVKDRREVRGVHRESCASEKVCGRDGAGMMVGITPERETDADNLSQISSSEGVEAQLRRAVT